MKEGKKKTTARKTSSFSASKRVVPKNQTPKMPAERSEPPKVKRIDVDEINKDFDDVETEDRRLIVFIAIAILVIVGTVIGLLVGCEKKENETKEPDKPGKTDVVVPEKPDEKGNKEDEDEGVETKEIVRKVKATYKAPTKSNKSSDSDNGKKDKEKDEKVTYTVTFYLGEETKTETVESGKTPSEYVPEGYSSCKYYTKSSSAEELDPIEESDQPTETEPTENTDNSEYDINTPITENINIYMSCDLITYTVDYGDADTSNPTTYNVEETVNLSDPITEQYFNGWFANPEFSGSKITTLDKSIIEYADSDNVIRLYAYITEEPIEENPTEEDPIDDKQLCEDSTNPECGVSSAGDNTRISGNETEIPEVETDGQVLEGEGETQVPEVLETPEVPEVTETPEEPEVTETPEEPEVLETPEVPEVTETPEEPEVPETPEVPEVPETPEEPEVLETPEVPEVTETPEEPEVTETPEVPEVLETPEVPEVTVESKQVEPKPVEEIKPAEEVKIVEKEETVEEVKVVEEPKKETVEKTVEKPKPAVPTKVEEPAQLAEPEKAKEPESPVVEETLTE